MKKPTFIIGKKHIILACLTLILGIAIYVNYVFATPNKNDIVADPTVSTSDSATPAASVTPTASATPTANPLLDAEAATPAASANSDSQSDTEVKSDSSTKNSDSKSDAKADKKTAKSKKSADTANETPKAANYGDTAFVMAQQATAKDGTISTSDTDGTDYFSQVRLARLVSRDAAEEQLSNMIGAGDTSDEENSTYTMAAVDLSALGEKESMIESLIKAQGFTDCVVYLSDDTANIVVKTDGLLPAQAAQIKDILLGEVTVPAENIRIFEVK